MPAIEIASVLEFVTACAPHCGFADSIIQEGAAKWKEKLAKSYREDYLEREGEKKSIWRFDSLETNNSTL